MHRDLAVDALRLGQVVQLALRQLRALVEEVDPLVPVVRRRHALAVVAIQVLEAARRRSRPLQQVGRLGVAGDRRQRLAQRRDRVFGVARLLAAARDLVVDGGGALGAVGADPVRVGVDAGQQLQRLLVARAQADHLGQALRGGVELLQLLAQHPPEAQQQVGAAAWRRRSPPAPARTGGRRAVVAQRAVDLARRLDRLDMLGASLPGRCGLRTRPLQAREMVDEQLAHLRLQLGDARRIAGARHGRRLHLQHGHVLGGPALLAVDVLEARGGAEVRRVAVDGVGQVGLGALGVAQLIEAQLGGQIEQLGGLGVVLDRLGAGLVERDQPIVLRAGGGDPDHLRRGRKSTRRSRRRRGSRSRPSKWGAGGDAAGGAGRGSRGRASGPRSGARASVRRR